MMKVMLIVPPWTIQDIRAEDTQGIAGFWPPIGTLYIASVLREHGFEEGVSTRLLIYAAKLIVRGIEPRRACDLAIAHAVTDDEEVAQAINEIVDVLLP